MRGRIKRTEKFFYFEEALAINKGGG